MGGSLAGDASLVLNTRGARDGQGFDYACHPPSLVRYRVDHNDMYHGKISAVPVTGLITLVH